MNNKLAAVFVCGVFYDNQLYRLDHKFYHQLRACKNRCTDLNDRDGENMWTIMYQDQFKPFNYDMVN